MKKGMKTLPKQHNMKKRMKLSAHAIKLAHYHNDIRLSLNA